MNWTNEQKEKLRVLWSQKPELSTSEIGDKLGCGKNAVIGQAGRMKLEKRRPPIKPSKEIDAVVKAFQADDELETLPMAEIAARLGVPRSQVKAAGRRLKLHLRGGERGKVIVLKGSKSLPPASPLPAVDLSQEQLGEAPCCWPLWGHRDRPSHIYCEKPVRLGRVWCPAHCEIGFIPMQQFPQWAKSANKPPPR